MAGAGIAELATRRIRKNTVSLAPGEPALQLFIAETHLRPACHKLRISTRGELASHLKQWLVY